MPFTRRAALAAPFILSALTARAQPLPGASRCRSKTAPAPMG
ncbi:MAG: hypothetical protein V4653_14640 [Pseudomonadota bacterium]